MTIRILPLKEDYTYEIVTNWSDDNDIQITSYKNFPRSFLILDYIKGIHFSFEDSDSENISKLKEIYQKIGGKKDVNFAKLFEILSENLLSTCAGYYPSIYYLSLKENGKRVRVEYEIEDLIYAFENAYLDK